MKTKKGKKPEEKITELCERGMALEKEGKNDDARGLYMQAWENGSNDYEKCIAAHFVARQQDSPEDSLKWNLKALELAKTANNKEVEKFYPSLYICVGQSYEKLGDYINAKKYIEKAAGIVSVLDKDDYGTELRKILSDATERIKEL